MRVRPVPYLREVKYLSPSSLRLFEEEPVRFFLERCGPEETRPPRDEQGFPAAVGTAFDALVKRATADVLGLECPSLADMLANVETEKERAVALGGALLRQYQDCGALSAFLLQQPSRLDQRLSGEIADSVDPVPLQGIVDAALVGGVHDWKVTGANAPGSRSPTAGYELFLGFDGTCKGPHERFGQPLEEIDERWAAQISVYGWLLGLTGPFLASIDEVVVGRGVARFRAVVTEGFQAALRDRYRNAWAAIQEERVLEQPIAGCGLDYVRTIKEPRWW